MEQLLLRVSEAAKIVGLGKSKTYELVASGALPSIRIGSTIRIPTKALEAWVSRQIAEQVGSNGAA